MYGVNYLVHLVLNKNQLQIGNIAIDLEGFEDILNKLFKIVLILILMYISIKIGKHIIKKVVDKQVKSNATFSLNPQRAKTLGEVLKSVLKYSVYFIGITTIFSIVFGGISFTFASMGGVAVGFGAQNLIKDFINGFFILFEDQFGVGDYVTIGKFSGIVQSVGIRTTVIKDFSGDVHSIPNGSIQEITNHSRGNIRFIVDVDIAYEEDIDNAINVIKKCCDEFYINNSEFINEPIEVLGVTALAASSVTIRIIGRSKPLKQWKMESELRKEIKKALDKNEIEIPYPKTQLVNANIEMEENKNDR